MRDLKYYENEQKDILNLQIKKDLKKGPITIPGGTIIKDEADIEKKSVQYAIRRVWREKGLARFIMVKQEPYSYDLRLLLPKPGQKINGIPLEAETIIPAYAPEIYEDSEINLNMIAVGLYLMLRTNMDEYYYELLMSFDLSFMPIEERDVIGGWEIAKL